MNGIPLILLISAGVLSIIVGNVLANMITKNTEKHPIFAKWTPKKRFFIIGILFIILSIPGICLQYRDRATTNSNDKKGSSEPLQIPPNEEGNKREKKALQTIEASIPSQKSTSFFGNSIYITANQVDVKKQEVKFTIGSPGYPPKTIEKATAGYSEVYKADCDYDVRIKEISICLWGECMDVAVTRIDNK